MNMNDLGLVIITSGTAVFLLACGISIIIMSIKSKGDK